MTDLTPIITACVTLISAVLTAFVVPYIRTRVSAEKLAQALTVAETAVFAAEQIFRETGMGEKKKEYVKQYLAERGYSFDEKELDVMIESAVYRMKEALI